MAAPEKHPDERGGRVSRMVVEARPGPATEAGAPLRAARPSRVGPAGAAEAAAQAARARSYRYGHPGTVL
ncbi:hypothetical protein GCM10009767_10770 [Kocuria aegyptia]|uniref:Uncharacterized protein n=1 Tax=Kocuria aegyptia TaxID=330943 RepID=A0ABN2KDG3_9MICC